MSLHLVLSFPNTSYLEIEYHDVRKELVLKVRYKPSVCFSALSYHKSIGFITESLFWHPALLTINNCSLLLFAGHNGRPCPDNRCQAHQQNRNHKPWPGGHDVSGRHTSPSPFPPPPPGHWSHLRASTRPWTADGSSWTEAHWKDPITCSKAERRQSQGSDWYTFSTETHPGYWASVLGYPCFVSHCMLFDRRKHFVTEL